MSLSLAALLAAAALSAAPAAPARRVAVLDFSASWAPECVGGAKRDQALREQCEILRLFADQARSGALGVLRPPGFVVMTRENTAQILKDMGGQCSEGECEVETARLLGASVVVSGEVTFLEGTYIVSLKVHDVASAALLGTGNTEAKSKLEAFRNVRAETERMLNAAAGLVSGAGQVAVAPAKPVPPPPKKVDPEGLLVLDVEEEDAQVLLDGKEIGTGPLEKELKLLEGSHRLVVMKPGFFTVEETVRIEVGGKVKAKPRLVRVPPPAAAPEAAASAPPAEEPRGWSDRRWSVELRIVPFGRTTGLNVDPPLEAPLDLMGVGLEVGRRFHREWRALYALDMVTGGHAASTVDDFGLNFNRCLLLTAGVAWNPAGNPWFSLGARAGISDVALSLNAGAVDPSQETISVGAVLDARLDVPIGRAWYVGARAGVAVASLGGDLSAPIAGGFTGTLEGGFFAMLQTSFAVGYRL